MKNPDPTRAIQNASGDELTPEMAQALFRMGIPIERYSAWFNCWLPTTSPPREAHAIYTHTRWRRADT